MCSELRQDHNNRDKPITLILNEFAKIAILGRARLFAVLLIVALYSFSHDGSGIANRILTCYETDAMATKTPSRIKLNFHKQYDCQIMEEKDTVIRQCQSQLMSCISTCSLKDSLLARPTWSLALWSIDLYALSNKPCGAFGKDTRLSHSVIVFEQWHGGSETRMFYVQYD